MADKMLDEYQDRISEIAKSDHLSPVICFRWRRP